MKTATTTPTTTARAKYEALELPSPANTAATKNTPTPSATRLTGATAAGDQSGGGRVQRNIAAANADDDEYRAHLTLKDDAQGQNDGET